jgi:Putative collagen-binding domain of a collagenase/Fibronectin type III domain/Protein of unknown function (DUF4038)
VRVVVGRWLRVVSLAGVLVAGVLVVLSPSDGGAGVGGVGRVGVGAGVGSVGSSVVADPRWPSSIVGRKVLDQFGDVYLMRTFSSWSITDLSDAEITTALEGVAGRGFNAVTVWAGGGYSIHSTWDPRYERKANGDDWWSGTPWASDLGAAWSALDHVVEESRRLGLTVNVSFCGGYEFHCAGPDWEGVTDADMRQVGVDVANRYPVASHPNVVWHLMLDSAHGPGSTRGRRVKALFDGINDTEGAATRPVRWMEPGPGGFTAHRQGWLADPDGRFSINTWYSYIMDSTELVENTWAEVTTVPVGDSEPPYDGASGNFAGDMGQQLRERSYATFLEGGCLINYGHEDWWPFGKNGLFSEGLDWDQVPAHRHTVEQQHVWNLIDQYVADPTWTPDGSFLTSGTGSGDTKAAAGRSATAAVAYFPTSRSVAVDTTVLAGTGPVRLRWYDPTTGNYTTIETSEPQQTNRTIPYPTAHPDNNNDWTLVIDLVNRRTVPTAPRSLTAHAGNGRARLRWSAPSSSGRAAINDYRVQRSADGGRTWIRVRDGVSTRRVTTVYGLTNGHRYRFRVAAVNRIGRGSWTAMVRVTPA